jgi:hypothetical protein
MNIFTQASMNSLSWNEDGFKLQNIRIAIQSTKHEEQIAHHLSYMIKHVKLPYTE